MIKKKGHNTYKCTDCTACFEMVAMDSCTQLCYCPYCGRLNTNTDTISIFDESADGKEQLTANIAVRCAACDNADVEEREPGNWECNICDHWFAK